MKTSGSKRIAERYVKALFDVAGPALAQVEADMLSLAKALAQSPELRHFLTNPLLSRVNQAQAMQALLAKMQASDVTIRFVNALAKGKRLAALPEITKIFLTEAARSRGEMDAELIAAAPLSAQEVNVLSNRLTKAYGKKINLAVREDPSLLGGVTLRIGSQQLDGSLAGKIRRLKQSLKAA